MNRVFVTGGTGLTGANVCEQLITRGDEVRALVRNPDEAQALADLGVDLVQGDITDADDVLRASKGCDSAIHSAALLGGASQDLEDFRAVNYDGTVNVLDAGKAHSMRRVVALSTGTFLDLSKPGFREDAPVLANPPQDPYTVTKLAAFQEAHRRAEAGDDVLTCHPGAIYGPGLVTKRALDRTSFNAVLLGALRGKIPAYLTFPVTWVAGADVASGSIAALGRGKPGARYWLTGRPEDEISTAAGCNKACEIAGVEHRVTDLDHRTASPELLEFFGPTLFAIAEAASKATRPKRDGDGPTQTELGYQPMTIDEGMTRFVDWVRALNKFYEMGSQVLAGQVAIVTGGARGIGAAVVRRLAADGATVVIADLDQAGAEAIAAEAINAGGQAAAISVDLAEEDSIVALVAQVGDQFGRIDILDNNAALTDAAVLEHDQDVATMDIDVWDRMFAVNLRSQFLMTKHVVPHMRKRAHGSIINVSSGAAMKGDLIRTAYSASKAAIESLTRSTAAQYGREGIRANTIVPGLILTDSARAGIPADMLARYTTTTLTPYVGAPEDVAGLVSFLAGEDSRYITGQTIVIDGGMSAHSARLPGLIAGE